MPPKRKELGSSDPEPITNAQPTRKKYASGSLTAKFPGEAKSSTSRSQQVGPNDGPAAAAAPAELRKLNTSEELEAWVKRAEKELEERYPGERIGVTKITSHLRKNHSLKVIYEQVSEMFHELHPEDDSTTSRESSVSSEASDIPIRSRKRGVISNVSRMSISDNDDASSGLSDGPSEIQYNTSAWGFTDEHVQRLIELHDGLANAGLKKKAGIWDLTTQNFCYEFKEFGGKPNLMGALKNLYRDNTSKLSEGVSLNRTDPNQKWEAKHIDFTEEAIIRDEPWKIVHAKFTEAFPEMSVTLPQLEKAHNKYSFVRRSGFSTKFSAEDKLKLLRFRQKYAAYGTVKKDILVYAHRALKRPPGSEATDEQIRGALGFLKNTSIGEWKQKMVDREANVIVQKAKRAERNKEMQKQRAEYNRKRVETWIEMYTAFGDSGIAYRETAQQLMKSKKYREVYKGRDEKAVRDLYQRLRGKKVTIEFLQNLLADMDAGKSAEILNEIMDAIDATDSDPDSDLDSLFNEDDESFRAFLAGLDNTATAETANAPEDSTEMTVYLQQIQLRSRLGGRDGDPREGSIKARVHQQQLQARLDIEILRPLSVLAAHCEIVDGEAYRNWLQLGDNVLDAEYNEREAESFPHVHNMLEERRKLLEESGVKIDQLREVAELDTLHHDYLTLWEDRNPSA